MDTCETTESDPILTFEDAARVAQQRAGGTEFSNALENGKAPRIRRKNTTKLGKNTHVDNTTGQLWFKSASETEIAAALQLGISQGLKNGFNKYRTN